MAQIKGLDSLLRKLDAMGGKTLDALERAVKTTVQATHGDASRFLPYSSILIQDETKRAGNNIEGKVFSNTSFAQYVEFGTGPKGQANHAGISPNVGVSYTQHSWVYPTGDGEFRTTSGQPAKPFLYPAAKQNESVFEREVAQELTNEIRRMGG